MIQPVGRVSVWKGRSAQRWTALVFVRRLACTWVLLALACVGPGCASPHVLADARDSPDALARAVLEAFAARDSRTLGALALSEREFRELVWPELPASRPERNLPFSYVWGDLDQKSRAKLAELMANHGGKRYALEKLVFSGGTTSYRGFVVHRESELTLRDAQGVESTVRLFGSMLQTSDGRCKVFSYNVDD